MVKRLFALAACFLGTSVYLAGALQPERVPLREPLTGFPWQIGDWKGQALPPFSEAIVRELGVDEYLSRVYVAGTPSDVVSLYVGYYQSQRQGDTIHSPMNCLPGAGWRPVEAGRLDVGVPGRPAAITVNRVIIEKGLDRQFVLYWYQSHGRVIASEYWSKIFMVTDAIRENRSDAALVRIIGPIRAGDGGIQDAERRATRFLGLMFPQLERHLPS